MRTRTNNDKLSPDFRHVSLIASFGYSRSGVGRTGVETSVCGFREPNDEIYALLEGVGDKDDTKKGRSCVFWLRDMICSS